MLPETMSFKATNTAWSSKTVHKGINPHGKSKRIYFFRHRSSDISLKQKKDRTRLTPAWPRNLRITCPVATSHSTTVLSDPHEQSWLLSNDLQVKRDRKEIMAATERSFLGLPHLLLCFKGWQVPRLFQLKWESIEFWQKLLDLIF